MTTTNLSNIGTTLTTQSPAQIAGSTPPTTGTNLSNVGNNMSLSSPAQIAGGGGAPIMSQDQLNALAKQTGFTGGAFSSVGLTPNTTQQTAQKYQSGLATAQSSNTPPPTTSGEAMGAINDTTSKTTQEQQQQAAGEAQSKAITEALKNNEGYQQLIKDHAEQQATQVQQETLTQEYERLSKDLGITGLNTQLVNMKAIMDGNEQDIRNEITAAGGFATNSAVLAMTAARNKTMIQSYNNLLQTRDNALNQINTMIGLSEKDKAIATQQAHDQLDFDKQILEYQDKMTTNAKSAYEKIISTPGYGYKALYDSTGGDSHTIGLIENTLGLQPGQLKSLGEKNAQTWSEPYKLGGDIVQKNNLTGEIRTAVNMPAGASGGSGADAMPTIPGDPTSQSILSHTGLSIAAFGYLTQGSTALTRMDANTRLKYMTEAQNWANKNGIDLATFQSQYEAYNTALQSNIKRVNNVKVAEGELTGTLANLASAADNASFNSMKWENVAKLFAGQQFNDANVSKYAFHLNQLRNELALYNSAAAGKPSADDSDKAEAERIIKDGFAKGSITGFQSALKSSVEKMDTVLQQNVERTNGQVWNLFGVTKPTVSLGTKVDTNRVNTLLSAQGIDYNDLLSSMSKPGAAPEGQFPAIDATTGKPYFATKEEIKSGKYLAI